jgi:hypothetical protein
MSKAPQKIEIYPMGHTRLWKWRAIFADGKIEVTPEYYIRKENAKAIAKMCYPGVMQLVLK